MSKKAIKVEKIIEKYHKEQRYSVLEALKKLNKEINEVETPKEKP